MNKKEITKAIREISDRLPPVKEDHVSGYYMQDVEDGLKRPSSHHYLVDVNHERRLRKAYMRHGMEGIKHYLDSIHQLQIKRNEELSKEPPPSTDI
jgi:hypothetical protein